ncbi:tetratricopeptide repeat protein 1-like [Liolophura sinensis]|uniref:tetratricopeptide repeat protein 1-like n=1 Tax=Liolophura sinensis TaxID=3198878 RepID=UPI00315892FD
MESNQEQAAEERTELSKKLENLVFVDAEENVVAENPVFRSGASGDSLDANNEQVSDYENVHQKPSLADRLNKELDENSELSQSDTHSAMSGHVSDSCSENKKKAKTVELSRGDNSSDAEQTEDGEDVSDGEDAYHSAEEGDIVIDEENLREIEETLTEEEKLSRREDAQALKESGNNLFKEGEYAEAIKAYGKGLQLCPPSFAKDRSIMYSNRAACHMRSENFEEAIEDSTKALELNPNYMKALLRRAELYEKTEKLDEALADYTQVVNMDPCQHAARIACARLPDQIKERNEKMKEEMLGKLKDLGNMILKPFGLSTNNFQLQQDPNTGGYSVQFNNNGK